MTLWKEHSQVERFLTGIRAALPLAGAQLDVMLRVLRTAKPEGISRFLDVGCGDGVLGRLLLEQHPASSGVFVDFSEPMLAAARAKTDPARAVFLQQDLTASNWREVLPTGQPFDAIVSGYAIHHLPDEGKKSLYKDFHELLAPGGVFINIEHVAPHDDWTEHLFMEAVIDNLAVQEPNRTRQAISDELYNAPEDGDILATAEIQCDWLREIGFTKVDCFMKIYELAVFGGVREK
jgi:tRNA (cmo5U34)-methyltransferase